MYFILTFCNLSGYKPNIRAMKTLDRRSFLRNSGLALGAGTILPAITLGESGKIHSNSWKEIKNLFNLNPNRIHMAQMLLASHPRPVREAIDMHRKKFDENPTEYWENNWVEMENRVLESAATYLQAEPQEIVLTDSTTMGLGILYTGLKLKQGDDILTTTHDHYSTEQSLEYAALKNGASIRKITLYENPSTAGIDEMVNKLVQAIKPNTRIIAATWVHSCTGMKLPIREMSNAIYEANLNRDVSNRIYFCVDGVHGFGIENVSMKDLGCDFFVAGTHKWLFGPRGTGILWGKKEAWDMVVPTIPAFRSSTYGNWLGSIPESQIGFSDLCSPGGFHAFEHRWSLDKAFDFHLKIGKANIEERTRQLNNQLKDALNNIKHVKLHTPMESRLSAGINCFEVEGLKPEEIVRIFHKNNIIASTSPYRISYARLTPCIINTEEEVNSCIEVLENINT